MNNTKPKTDFGDQVTDYCIDNKLTIAQGLVELIEKKFELVEQGLASLKADITETIQSETAINKARQSSWSQN